MDSKAAEASEAAAEKSVDWDLHPLFQPGFPVRFYKVQFNQNDSCISPLLGMYNLSLKTFFPIN